MRKIRLFRKADNAYIILLLTAILGLHCGDKKNQMNADLDNLIPDSYKEWSSSDKTEHYDRRTIFDYIDGAGEVYLLYDFKKVIVRRFANPDSIKLTVELFNMGKPDDAFGIFSHSREDSDIGIGEGSEYRDGYLCFWKNRYFVCVYSADTGEEINNAIIELGKAIDSSITGKSSRPELVGCLPAEDLRKSSEIFFHKQASLNYHYYLAEDNILNLSDSTDAVLAIYDPGRATLLCIKYPRKEAARISYNDFISKYVPEAQGSGSAQTENGKWVKVISFENYLVIIFDAMDNKIAGDLIDLVKDNILRIGNEHDSKKG